MRLDRKPTHFHGNACLARFHDDAPAGSLTRGRDGGYARGLLFVGFDPDTLAVRWTEGVRVTGTSEDARAHPDMHVEFRALFDGKPDDLPWIL